MKQFLEATNFLQSIAAQAEANSNEARQLVAGLSEQQLNWKPRPDQWSMAECLDHLTLSNAAFVPYLASAIARGRTKAPVQAPPPYQPTRIGGWLIRQVSPEAPRKLKAPKIFRPAEPPKISNALDHFLDGQAKFLNLVRQVEGVDYNIIRLRSPVTPLIRYSLADALVVTVVHEQRHLGQAGRVRHDVNFPGS